MNTDMQSQMDLIGSSDLQDHYEFIYHLYCMSKTKLMCSIFSTMPEENKQDFLNNFLVNHTSKSIRNSILNILLNK